MSVRFRRWKSQ